MWYETVNYRLYWYRRCNRWSNKFPWSEYQTSSLFRSPLYFFQIPTVLVLFRSPLYLFFSYPQCCIHCCAPSNFYRILSNCYRILSNCYRILRLYCCMRQTCHWFLCRLRSGQCPSSSGWSSDRSPSCSGRGKWDHQDLWDPANILNIKYRYWWMGFGLETRQLGESYKHDIQGELSPSHNCYDSSTITLGISRGTSY